MQIKNWPDFLTGIGMIAFCTIVLTQTGKLANQVAMFPRAVMAVGIGIGIAVLVKSFLVEQEENKERKPFDRFAAIELLLLLLVFSILIFAGVLGLYACTYLIMAAVSTYIAWCRYGFNLKIILLMLVYNAAVVAVLYLLFKVVLGIRAPEGILF